MTSLRADRIAVIVGVGEVNDRPVDPALGLEPLALMAEALRRADADAGGGFLAGIDALDIVNQMTWRYADLPAQLTTLLGISPRRAVYGPVGGESPVRLLHDAAMRIARGESEIGAVCGAEAQYSVNKARAAKLPLPWTALAPKADLSHLTNFMNPVALQHGVLVPAQVYPFYESATQAAWGQTPAEAGMESGELWEKFALAASLNPASWSKRAYQATEIIEPSLDNRLVAWPYTKRMVANPAVNMGAAVLVTSLEKARTAGIPEDRLIYILGGSSAVEPRDYLLRDQFVRSHAQDVVLEAAQALAGPDGFGAMELYSCFPVVPKMARRSLGLGRDVSPTVTGGLSFFGAPVNNYMTHAAAALTRVLRRDGERPGLLYGQGEYVTKHHALVLSRRAPEADTLSQGYSRQAEADARRGPVPAVLSDYAGPATIEASTVLFGRDGEVEHGVVIARTPEDSRLMARVGPEDGESLAVLLAQDRTPVGSEGSVRAGADGLLHWWI